MRQEFFYCSKCLNTTVLLYYTILYTTVPLKYWLLNQLHCAVLYKQLNIL